MIVVDAVDDPVQARTDALLGLEVEHDPVQPVLGQRPEQVAAEDPHDRPPARAADHSLDQQDRDHRTEQDRRHGRMHARELVEQSRSRTCAARRAGPRCGSGPPALRDDRHRVKLSSRRFGAEVRAVRPVSSFRDGQAAQAALVVGAPGAEPQAGDVSLSAVRQASAGAQRAHADRSRRAHSEPPPPRPLGVRARGPRAGRLPTREEWLRTQPRPPRSWAERGCAATPLRDPVGSAAMSR